MAVYSRCAKEPPSGLRGRLDDSLLYITARGCRAYLYDFAREREVPLKIDGAARSSVIFPSVWRDTIAYGRLDDRSGASRRPAQIVLRTRRGARESVSVSKGTIDDHTGDEPVSGPTGIDVRGDRVTFTWDTLRTRCRAADDTSSRAASVFGFRQTELWVRDGRASAATLVERGCTGDGNMDEATSLFAADFDSRARVQYGFLNATPGGDTGLRRWNAVTGRYSRECPGLGGDNCFDLLRLGSLHFMPATRAFERPLP